MSRKRLVSMFVVVFMLLVLSTSISAAELPTQIILKVGQSSILVNGELVDDPSGTAPIIRNGSTLLPISGIINILGGKTDWSASERKVTISLNESTVELWIDKSNAQVNGRHVSLQTPPTIVNGKTMVPLRFVSENLGMEVIWHGANNTITLHAEKGHYWFSGNHVQKLNNTYSTFNEGYANYSINYLNEWGMPYVILKYTDDFELEIDYTVVFYMGEFLGIQGHVIEEDIVVDPYSDIVDKLGIDVSEKWGSVSLEEVSIKGADAAFLKSEVINDNVYGDHMVAYELYIYNGHKITVVEAGYIYNENDKINHQVLSKEKKYLDFFLGEMMDSIYFDVHAGAAG